MLNPLAQPMNHFYIQTTIDGLTPFQILQHTIASMFRQGYTQTTPSFSMPNFSLIPYTPRVMAEHMQTPNSKYQAPYSTVAYTNLIPLLGRTLVEPCLPQRDAVQRLRPARKR
jgi:hypothetical protein